MSPLVKLLVATVGVGVLVFHPSRLWYMRHRDVSLVASDGVVLRGTLSTPRWRRTPAPGVVIVHGSGPLGREQVRGDVRTLVRRGFAVLAYDKRGVGQSGGVFLRQWGDSAPAVLRRLAGDAATAFDSLAADRRVDGAAVGFFGASQAGWIMPLAATLTQRAPRFLVILSGPAVSTAVEQYYSDLTGDGSRPPQVSDAAERERLVHAFRRTDGYDPLPVLAGSAVPTLWLLGDRDESVPTFATARRLDSLRATGVTAHTVVRFAQANHGLLDLDTRETVPFWDTLWRWLDERVAVRP